jgi:hypothetical protein
VPRATFTAAAVPFLAEGSAIRPPPPFLAT